MAREIVTVGSDMLVEDAAKLLAYHNISGMPVEDPDGKVCGIVSEADVIGHIGAIVVRRDDGRDQRRRGGDGRGDRDAAGGDTGSRRGDSQRSDIGGQS